MVFGWCIGDGGVFVRDEEERGKLDLCICEKMSGRRVVAGEGEGSEL